MGASGVASVVALGGGAGRVGVTVPQAHRDSGFPSYLPRSEMSVSEVSIATGGKDSLCCRVLLQLLRLFYRFIILVPILVWVGNGMPGYGLQNVL